MRAGGLYPASDQLNHDLRRRLVSEDRIKLMRHWAPPWLDDDSGPGRRVICKVAIPGNHDELLHGILQYSKSDTGLEYDAARQY
jgi:hypothetical protein